jgi:cob(I)alamin adenosyltransferase
VGGARVAKDSLRIRAFGSYDELDAELGRASAALGDRHPEVAQLLLRLQHELFVVRAELATPATAAAPAHRIEERHVRRLEADTDQFSAAVEPVHTFVLPRGNASGTSLHVCRTVARRAERDLWSLSDVEPVRPELLQWGNRLSDLLFAVALTVNRTEGFVETPPDYTV